eukprot:CAMPEP_0206531354 /NCGR_PEP_ID=MMETSP0325_2-20121206/3713_1 /ASSEMBLY_ACC=CAM_ASM_000347 /TAXON_ID=2866 /ORGANISM="Crypthecodinium cohnii, Strain Seligo" /LENGTH=384 /DNA_ID=CAMNT_0054027577 /DNA_START=96 /DNA_END=1247 /DNA_ORIENTATION=+
MAAAADFVVNKFTFTSEACTEAVPDKLCDRVADAILDACLEQDPEARVCCEATTKTSMVMILGEVVTKASVNYEQVMREAIRAVGYDSEDKGLDARTANIIVAIEESAPDLAQAMSGSKAIEEVGNGDMGIAVGYATDETPELMPLSQLYAAKLCAKMDEVRKDRSVPWLKLGGRAQVTLEYAEKADGSLTVERVRSITLSAPRSTDVKADQVEKDLVENVIMKVDGVSPKLLQGAVMKFPEPKLQTQTDVGMSGKQLAGDTYGGWGGSSSSSVSGKDGTKAARSGTYGARWAARSLVASRLCRRASVQLSYLPGSASPASVAVHSYGTGLKASGKTDAELADLLTRHFDFRPSSLQKELSLKTPQFQKISAYGHFGRSDATLA